MNSLKVMGDVKTMSSLEIAKLTGKDHADVLKDIRRILAEVGIGESRFSGSYISKQNKEVHCFNLPYFEALLVLTSFSNIDLKIKALKATNILHLRDLLSDIDVKDLNSDQFIYVAMEEQSGRYKVGISKNPEERITQLNVGNPERLILVHAYLANESGHLSEKLAHEALCKHHIRSEWFAKDADLSVLPSYCV